MIGIVVLSAGMIGTGIDGICDLSFTGQIKGLLFWMASVKLICYERYC
jgi:hypothetical protein